MLMRSQLLTGVSFRDFEQQTEQQHKANRSTSGLKSTTSFVEIDLKLEGGK